MVLKSVVSIFLAIIAVTFNVPLTSSFPTKLPRGFVYIKDVDASIIENMRYYTSENFIGKRLDGYLGKDLILTKVAAKALSNVQQELRKDGYSLVVYDAYRPQETVDQFVRWAKDVGDQSTKEKYYPNIDKEIVLKAGYITKTSGHSRGSTVDLTIIKLGEKVKNITSERRVLKDGSIITYLNDGTVDAGSSFDLFDRASHHDSEIIDKKYLEMRNLLRSAMRKHGFYEFDKEWWHYTLENEPFPTTFFNFPIA